MLEVGCDDARRVSASERRVGASVRDKSERGEGSV